MIGLIRPPSVDLPCNALLTMYKSFIRSYLDYGDILHDTLNNEIFRTKRKKNNIELV